jgi:ERCC4-related helicase
MDLIALLIFDECHHAQAQKRHPYAQIMKVTALCTISMLVLSSVAISGN